MSPRIAIVGAGALGGHVGGYLARAGRDVTLIDAWPDHVMAMRAHGLTLAGLTAEENFTQKVRAIHITDVQAEAKRPFDVVFIAVKSYDTVWASAMMLDYVAPGGFFVSLQNGINEERLAGVVGWGRTLGCIASAISVELTGPARIQRTVMKGGAKHTVFRVGEPHGRITARSKLIAELVSSADSAKATDNLWGERWSKLIINSMRNPVSAATGRGGNANERDPATRRAAIRIAAETIKVGLAHGYVLEDVYKMPPAQIVAAAEGDKAKLEATEATLLEGTKARNDDQRPSMGQDIRKGRRTEIDHINGLVVAKARDAGIPVPANEAIIAAVKRIERGEAKPSPELVAGT